MTNNFIIHSKIIVLRLASGLSEWVTGLDKENAIVAEHHSCIKSLDSFPNESINQLKINYSR